MWQPRGLDYSLYTVLSRHHSGGKDFFLSSFLPEEDAAAEHFSSRTSSTNAPTGSAAGALPQFSKRMLLATTATSGEKEGKPDAKVNTIDLTATSEEKEGLDEPDTEVDTIDLTLHCRAVLPLQRKEDHEPTEFPVCRNETDVGDDAPDRIVGRISGVSVAEAPEPMGEDVIEIRNQHGQREDETGKAIRSQGEVQLHQAGQDLPRRQPEYERQNETERARPPPLKRQESQAPEHHPQTERETHLPAYFHHMSIPLEGAVDARGKDNADVPRASAFMRTEYRTRLGDFHPEPKGHIEASGEMTASPSSVSPITCPPPYAEHLCTSMLTPHAESNGARAAAMCCVAEGCSCEAEDKIGPHSCIAPAAPSYVAPSGLVGTSTASTASNTTANEPLVRLSSAPVLPSFRILILFGSTSGVSAAVAFSIFHTFVHRLLSSSKRLQRGGYAADRPATFSLGPVSPNSSMLSRQISLSEGMPTACCKDNSATVVSATESSSSPPRSGAAGVHVAFVPSENSPTNCSEGKGSQKDAANRQSERDDSIFVDAKALYLNSQSNPNMTDAWSLSPANQRELLGVNLSENCITHHETGTGEVSGEGVGTKETIPQHVDSEHRWQHVQPQQRQEVTGHDQGWPPADHNRTPQTSRTTCFKRQGRQFQGQNSAQGGKEQPDQQQLPARITAGFRPKSSYTEKNQSVIQEGACCTGSGGPEMILEKREAAAQAAEVASIGLKAAAAVAYAALKAGEQRTAGTRRAATAVSAAQCHCKEERKTWFMDEMQIGRVGVYIQSMQYFTFDDLLEFVEESRDAFSTGAVVGTATREAGATSGMGSISCRTGLATDAASSISHGANDSAALVNVSHADRAVSGEGASGCLCGNSRAAQNDCPTLRNGTSSVRLSDCGMSLLHSAAKVATAAGPSHSFENENLSNNPHTLILYCISTNMGGAPPESAASFFSEVLEAADDFRVSRGSLRGCCVAGVGCGSTDYPQSTYCKPARQLMIPLHRLGAQVLMQQPLLLLTDTSAAATTEVKLTKWRQQLVQQVERLLQATAGEDVRQLLQEAKEGAIFPRRKQNQQHRRQQSQPRQPSLVEEHAAFKDNAAARSVSFAERFTLKEGGNVRLRQGQDMPVSDATSNNNRVVSQNSPQDLPSVSDVSSTSDSEEQSDDSYDDADDEDGVNSASSAGNESVARSKLESLNPKRRRSTFTGVGSAVCGGSGSDDLEDVAADADALDEAGMECDGEHSNSQQASTAHVPERRRRSQLCRQQEDQVSYPQLTGERERQLHGAHEHTPIREVKKKRQQWRERGRQIDRTPEKMIKPRHAEQLSKEGYRLIGSHSAVKLCRWTKSQLRGRGGCYKHTFYGITSSQCMEMTPSLACANKCIFCWRHHKNPVGTSWRWQMDEEGYVVNEAITQHFKAIKELKGMAEVKEDRLDAARTSIRHCALSLVGEPIMYPRIAALVKLLHQKHISTFLVTNAQFPDALASLPPVTQLYLSVDAASAKDLKALDQPLFNDYWERFTKCMEILRFKRQRTVYRLTLVAGYNMPDLATLGQAQDEPQSGAHQAGRQQATVLPRSSSDKKQPPPIYHAPSTERSTGGLPDRRGSHGDTSSTTCPCGDAAATLSPSPASLARTFSSPSKTPAMCSSLTSNSEQGVATENCLRIGEGSGADHFPGRSAKDYAALVLKGLPDFIEVKAVTYAGTSKHSKITMKNIPWHDQVVNFCKDLCAALPEGLYELACAHRHSCCVLIAKTEYKKNGQWHTWIDYEKFHELAATGHAEFAGTDYCAPTPDWAVFGHAAAGFSPFEARVYTKGKQKRLQPYTAAAEICQA